jgi:hypothetical protein
MRDAVLILYHGGYTAATVNRDLLEALAIRADMERIEFMLSVALPSPDSLGKARTRECVQLLLSVNPFEFYAPSYPLWCMCCAPGPTNAVEALMNCVGNTQLLEPAGRGQWMVPLCEAARWRSFGTIVLLLDAGADPDRPQLCKEEGSTDSRTPVDFAMVTEKNPYSPAPSLSLILERGARLPTERQYDYVDRLVLNGSKDSDCRQLLRFLAEAGGAVRIEQLPGYAPDLNPDEGVWHYLKHVELPNVACHDFGELRCQLRLRSCDYGANPT